MNKNRTVETLYARGSFLLLLLSFVLIFSACRSETEYDEPAEPQPIVFIGNTGSLISTWNNGDRIGIFAINSGTTLQTSNIIGDNNNIPFITDGSGMFQTQTIDILYPENGAPMDFIAYYPFTTGIENFSIPINIFTQTDILYSNNLTNITANTEDARILNFHRPLANLIINITPEAGGGSLANLTAVMTGAKTRATFSLVNGELLIDEESETDIGLVVSHYDNWQTRISVLMLPTHAPQNIYITFTSGENTKVWTLPEALEANSTHSFNITMLGDDTDDTDYPIILYPDTPPLYQFWELPLYTRGIQPPNTIEARHKVGNRNWLNTSLPLPEGTIRNFTVLFDTYHRMPLWVAYPLHPIYLRSGNRTNDWGTPDPLIPVQFQPNLLQPWRSLTSLSYDRGHVLPSADRSASPQLNATTFFNTNLVIQSRAMNRGVWEELEAQVRTWSRTNPNDTIYIVSGQILHTIPIFAAADNNNVPSAKPQYMYKAILRRNMRNGTFTSIGFKMANTEDSAPHTQSVVSVARLEEITGFTFFPRLPDGIADAVKANTDIERF